MAITALPTPPSTSSPSTFAAQADALLSALPTFVTEANALEANVNSKESSAVSAASTATTQAGIATTQAGIATSAASSATATLAQVQNVANGVSFASTSTTSLVIGTGSKTFTVQTGESYVAGMPIYAVDAGNSANYMVGTCTSYSGSTLVVLVTQSGGSGTIANWNISIGGIPGPAGPTFLGGSLTSAINVAKATVASHATTADIWGAAGNLIDFTGTATVTSFPAAPQAGAERRLVCAAACSFTNGVNLIVQGGVNYTAAAGDIVTVTAITTTQFRLTIEKASGTAVAGGSGQIGDVIISTQAPADTNYKEAGLVYTQATYPAAFGLIGLKPSQFEVVQNAAGYSAFGKKDTCPPGGGWSFFMKPSTNMGYVTADGSTTYSPIVDVGGTGSLNQIVGGTSSMALLILANGYGWGFDPASPGSMAQMPAQVSSYCPESGFFAFNKFWMVGYDTGSADLKIVSNNATMTGSWAASTISSNGNSAGQTAGLFFVSTGASSGFLIGASVGAYTSDSGATWTRTTGAGARYHMASDGQTVAYYGEGNVSNGYIVTYAAAWPLTGRTVYRIKFPGISSYTFQVMLYTMGYYWIYYTKSDSTGVIVAVNAKNPSDQTIFPVVIDDSTAWSTHPMLQVGASRLMFTQSANYISNVKLINYTQSTQFFLPIPGSPPPGFKSYVKLL